MLENTITTWMIASWLAAGLLVKAWLARRQDRFLARHRDRVPAAFTATVTAAEQARAVDYSRARLKLQLFTSAWALLLALVWTLGGALASLAAVLPPGWLGGIALLAAFAALHELLRLPPRLLQIFGVDGRFGFNRAGPLLVARDALFRSGLSALLAAVAGALLLAPILLWNGLGWIAAALLAVAGGGFLLWAQPRLIAPLFNSFRPLPQGRLRTRLEAMIERCGAHAESMFIMNGSKRSALANAYFSGFGRAKRVVLFDTLLSSLNDDEIEAVLAHELGHDRAGHIRRHYAVVGALLLAGVILLGAAGQAGILAALAIPDNAAAWLAAGYLLWPLLAWPLRPWLAARLRRYEFEADAYAAAHADARALSSALKKLLTRNAAALCADPLYTAFHASHPPPDRRLAALSRLTREPPMSEYRSPESLR